MPHDLRRRAARRAALIATLALLAGCATPLFGPPPGTVTPPPAATREAAPVPPAAAAQRKLERALQALQQRPSNLARARNQLKSLLASRDADAQALHPYAHALLEQLDERRRLGALNDRLTQQLERSSRELKESELRNDELERKLEALAEIEHSLSPRGGAGAQPPGSGPQ